MKPAMAGAAALCLFAVSLSKGGALEAVRLALAPALTPVVVFGPEPRATIEDFARLRRLDPASLSRRYAATGIVHCGDAHGAGQLTLAADVVTTAAHVLYDRSGRLRGDSAHCAFVVETDGVAISTALQVDGAVAGSTDPYNESAVHDWAVVKLARPLREAEPYPLAAPPRAASGAPVLFVARGARNWRPTTSLQQCRLRDGLEEGAEGTREFAFDCAAGVGASGAGLFDGDGRGLMAIFVGFRSAAPDEALPFSPQHYNFAVTLEGAFRRAVERQAALGATAEAR
jgi:Trypsin-like peptidase domain